MAAELVCPNHGPYDASYGTCPYCQAEAGGRRPAPPAPLSEDDLPTDLGAVPARGFGSPDDEETELGARRRGRPLDEDDLEPTELGVGARGADDTVLDDLQDVTTGPLAMLWVKDGRRRGHISKVKEGAVIGRKDGDLILDDPKVSNPHAKFTIEDKGFVVWDFGSKNGTYVNGERIRAATPLKENDLVKIGDTTFVFKVLE